MEYSQGRKWKDLLVHGWVQSEEGEPPRQVRLDHLAIFERYRDEGIPVITPSMVSSAFSSAAPNRASG
eukprot:7337323-Alexandrium_andersonii.AAC.1